MALSNVRILIVSDDTETTAALAEHLVTRLEADVTVVGTIEEAKVITASDAFEVILASETLPDGSGISVLDAEDGERATPLVLLDTRLDARRTLSALRGGAVDVFAPPIEWDRLGAVIRHIVQAERDRKHKAARSRRLRRLSSRLLQDRRELRRRVDLICRDLVQSYRRLAEKVVTSHPDMAGEPPGQVDSCNPRP